VELWERLVYLALFFLVAAILFGGVELYLRVRGVKWE